MPKKCIICEKEAEFVIKGTSDSYCAHCAEECFGDTAVLQSIEEQAKELRELLKQRIDEIGTDLQLIETTGQDAEED